MTRTITAHFDGRVIIPDEPVQLPVGQRLSLRVELDDNRSAPFAELSRFAVDLPDAPADLSARHDHYLYGSPER